MDRNALVTAWWRALSTTSEGPAEPEVARGLLTQLVDTLLSGLLAPELDPAVGAKIGEALADAGWTDTAVPIRTVQVLQPLAEDSERSDAGARFAVLGAAVAQGHQMYLTRQQLRQDQNARFRVVFDSADIAIAIGDTDGTLVDANRGLAEMIGVPVEQLRGISIYDFAHPDDQEEIRSLIFDKLVPAGEGSVRMERRLLRSDGDVGWVAFSITFVRGTQGYGDYLLAVGEDVTERHRLQQELHWQARHDPLTGLPNRRSLLERIETVSAGVGDDDHVGLCFVDLDRFKPINDMYGHGTGDRVLTEVATRFGDSVREQDCLIARIGGDEFVALIPPPAENDVVTTIVDRLQSALVEPIAVDGHQLHVSASIGAIVTPLAGSDAESLLDSADTVLYLAKANHKGRSVLRTSHRTTDRHSHPLTPRPE
ncbi:sensor domain-containing diguanylate cyclase [Nocardia sp. CA2R105]|uniref:sensor domain-containing diguanylate cyclase n=1 Tax=Nocardia coffeae TaxID=2873381 RepID=UPI001CA75824|nr:sensor domain-containing diguanylate cyclase [Nocardia coffeae]MBY8859348.1 sensor domain-containing diguanylate cyclase [Nocardia coffeae]